MVTVGGHAWLSLVKSKLLQGYYADPNQLRGFKPTDDIKALRKELDDKLPLDKQAVRGRGRYRGKLVKRHRPLDEKMAKKVTSKAMAMALKNKKVDMGDVNSMGLEDLQSLLEQLTQDEMHRNMRKAKPEPQLEMPKLERAKTHRALNKRNGKGRFTIKKPTKTKPRDILVSGRRARHNSIDYDTGTEGMTTDHSDFSSDTDETVDHSTDWGYDSE
jgi:hypothetical protein